MNRKEKGTARFAQDAKFAKKSILESRERAAFQKLRVSLPG
jgi:hypothetical protein